MKPDARRLLEEALKLSVEARADLAGVLISSLDEDVEEGAESAWADEIERRLAEIDAGSVKPVSWKDARRAILSDEDPSGGA
jgi:putative addiction module component (TIGR02574 family)